MFAAMLNLLVWTAPCDTRIWHQSLTEPACVQMLFPKFLELIVSHVLVLEKVHKWVPVAQLCGCDATTGDSQH